MLESSASGYWGGVIRLGIILLLTADYSCFAYGKKKKNSSDPLQLVHWRVGGRGHSLGLMWNRQSIARQIVPWGHTFLAAAQNRRLLLTQLMCTWFELDGKITRLGNKSLSNLPPRFGISAPTLSCQRQISWKGALQVTRREVTYRGNWVNPLGHNFLYSIADVNHNTGLRIVHSQASILGQMARDERTFQKFAKFRSGFYH